MLDPMDRSGWTARLTLVLYSVPVFATLVRRVLWVRLAGVWLAIALVLQVALTPFVIDNDFKTLPPHMGRVLTIAPDAIVGINGVQTITTDEKGFRTTKPVDYASDRAVRIFAIGGSTTEQIALDDQSTWTHLLEEQLDPTFDGHVEVINTGVSGLRALHHLATLRAIEAYHPSLVLIMVGVNDWNKQLREHFGNTSYGPTIRIQDTILGKAIGVAVALAQGGPTAHAATFDGSYYRGRSNSLAKSDQRTFRPVDIDPDYRATLEALAARCKQAAYGCVFITQPNAYDPHVSPQLKQRFWMTPPDEPWTADLESLHALAGLYNRSLIEIACAAGIPVIDLAKDLPATFDVFFDDVHFNESGAREVAARLTPPVRSLLEARRDRRQAIPGFAACPVG